MPKVLFNNTNRAFYNQLKEEVDFYFQKEGVKKTGNWKLYLKTAILVPAAIGLYLILLLVPFSPIVGILLCAALGFSLASIGFNVMHDACHGSYSSKKWVNSLLSLTMNALGGNSFIWKQKHNIIHHTYTNVEGVDDDIAQSKFLRQCNSQEWMPVHKYQHIYLPFIYALTIFVWVLVRDYERYFSKKIYTTTLQKMTTRDHFTFWISKILYLFFYIFIPIALVGFVPWLIGFLVMGVVMGITLSTVFQLAHAVEGAEFVPTNNETKNIESEWAIHQVKTTVNFATNNKFISWFVGGLNFQVEHHLFPRISHVHYPAVSKIVKKVCNEHDIPYLHFKTMFRAFVSHVKVMKMLGQKPVPLRANQN